MRGVARPVALEPSCALALPADSGRRAAPVAVRAGALRRPTTRAWREMSMSAGSSSERSDMLNGGSSRFARATALVAVGSALLIGGLAGPAAARQNDRHGDRGSYVETPVVSDQPGMAPVTDPNLVNPWGIAFGPDTPLWVANNGTSTSTLYGTNPAPAKQPLVVTTQPGPTGTVFNDTTEFALPDGTASKFLFASVSGQLSAWGGGTQTTTTESVSGTAFTGLALAHTDDGARLYAADAASTNVLVYNGKWQLDDIL